MPLSSAGLGRRSKRLLLGLNHHRYILSNPADFSEAMQPGDAGRPYQVDGKLRLAVIKGQGMSGTKSPKTIATINFKGGVRYRSAMR